MRTRLTQLLRGHGRSGHRHGGARGPTGTTGERCRPAHPVRLHRKPDEEQLLRSDQGRSSVATVHLCEPKLPRRQDLPATRDSRQAVRCLDVAPALLLAAWCKEVPVRDVFAGASPPAVDGGYLLRGPRSSRRLVGEERQLRLVATFRRHPDHAQGSAHQEAVPRPKLWRCVLPGRCRQTRAGSNASRGDHGPGQRIADPTGGLAKRLPDVLVPAMLSERWLDHDHDHDHQTGHDDLDDDHDHHQTDDDHVPGGR